MKQKFYPDNEGTENQLELLLKTLKEFKNG